MPTASDEPVRSVISSDAFDGRVVMVTGGAQGIGRGIAGAVLAAGGRVLIVDSDADAGAECIAHWEHEGAAFARADVAREGQVRGAVAKALRRFGRLDGLVNNAGIADPYSGPLDQLDAAAWRRRIDVNLGGAFLCAKHALPALREARGAIVNIASTRALQSEPYSEAYAASKGGLLAFTHALAVSEGPKVRVNAISPGWIAVSDWRKHSESEPPELSRRDHAQHPAGRVGRPPDVAALALFLLSEAAGFVTGANFVVDGGMVRRMRYDD